jgi:hypothetical protein
MLTQEALGVVDGHPINARSSLVVSNALPRAHEILSFAHLLHQLHRCSRAFGLCHRHDRFGATSLHVERVYATSIRIRTIEVAGHVLHEGKF